MAATAANREKFIKSLMDLLETFNLDGVDLDWEYPVAGTYIQGRYFLDPPPFLIPFRKA